MPTQVTNYQCPACTGPLHFDAATGRVSCEYCGSSYEIAEIEALYAEKEAKAAQNQTAAEAKQEAKKETAASSESDWDTSGLNEDWGEDGQGMRAYLCPSCGAELICEETTAATSCPYCGNPTVVPGQFTGALKPDYVIPFKLKKADAVAALKKHYEGRPFLPKAFKDENHVQEIMGVYVPFWLFDGEAEGDMVFDATRSHTFRSGNYRITQTDHFDVYRSGKVAFSRIPVDASKKMPDDYMDSIEPFDYGEMKDFSTAYLPGYLADKYDVTAEESGKRADRRAESSAADSMRDSVDGYSTVVERQRQIKLHRGAVKYALLPVWMLSTQWNGEKYLFAMNGQTGKMVGKLPVDKKKRLGIFAAVYAATALVTLLISLLLS